MVELLLLLIGLVAGTVCAVLGLRGRRQGPTPHCRRCGYTLIGITSDRCPECGSPLTPRNIVHGRRVRRPRMAIVGLLLALGSGAFLGNRATGFLAGIDWYRYRPTRWVISDVKSTSPAIGTRAWSELQRRQRDRPLDAANLERLAAVALGFQTAPGTANLHNELLDWLGDQVAQNKIPESQRQQFFKQFVTTDLQVRQKVGASDPVAYLASFQVHGPENGWWDRLTFLGASLDGKPLRGTGGSSSSGSGGGGGSFGSTVPATQPGRHTLAVTGRIEIFPGAYLSGTSPAYSRDLTDSARFQVLDAGEIQLKETDDPTLAPLVRQNLIATDFVVDPARKQIQGKLEVKSAPSNLAFDAFVRAGGKEYSVGWFAMAKGTGSGYSLYGINFDAGPIDHADLVLRSSPSVARRTVDLFEIWKGQIVIENVPIKVRTP